MRILLSTTLAIFLIAMSMGCGDIKKDATSTAAEYIPQRSDYTFKTRVCYSETDDVVLYDTIITYLTDAQGRTDTLWSWAVPLDTANWASDSFGKIEEKDYNFDGIADLQVCLGPFNAFGNYTYDAFLWDEAQHKFVRIPGYDDLAIFSPEVNAAERQIVSCWRLDDDLEFVTYEWKDGRLVEVGRTQEKYE